MPVVDKPEAIDVLKKIIVTMRNSNFVTKQQSTLNLKMKKKLRVKILKYSFTFLGIDLICIFDD